MRKNNRIKEDIIAMIPAKIGSMRLPMKNLALLHGKPLIYYAIKAAKGSRVFDRIVVNAEDALFSKIAGRYGVDFYKRPQALVRPTTKTDEVVYDFLKKNTCDIVAWVSPIAPLETGKEVSDIVNYFVNEKLDSLMTVKDEQVHCVYKRKPVNFRMNDIFAQTQDLVPVQPFVYSVMMWRSSTFVRTFEQKGHAILSGKVGFYAVSKPSSIIVKKKEDLIFANNMMRGLLGDKNYDVKYDRTAQKQK